MCGPFFSVMPFPSTDLYTFSHVRYTPHASWAEPGGDKSPHEVLQELRPTSQFDRMARDATRYLPCLAGAAYERSLWEVKTILPVNDADDGRPILFKRDVGWPGFHCVLGGKIDNVDDVLQRIGGPAGPLGEVA
jgi:hypothetical protein